MSSNSYGGTEVDHPYLHEEVPTERPHDVPNGQPVIIYRTFAFTGTVHNDTDDDGVNFGVALDDGSWMRLHDTDVIAVQYHKKNLLDLT